MGVCRDRDLDQGSTIVFGTEIWTRGVGLALDNLYENLECKIWNKKPLQGMVNAFLVLACLPAFLPARLPVCLPACFPACLLASLLASLPPCLHASLPAYLLTFLLACLSSLELIFNVLLNNVQTHARTDT